ncbi:MAG: hypothetical protein KIS97_17985 [Nitrospira sp.]|nr:hypothetical protein [Nitrospira sp.]MCW5796225.1 hypothetical protein [Nitrospira sp.]
MRDWNWRRRISAFSCDGVAAWFLCALALSVIGCYNRVVLQEPVVWEVNDRRPISEPQEETIGQWALWDGTDKMVFYRIGQLFNLGRSMRDLGAWVGLADPIEAQNVNAFDEVPNSTWFTNRQFFSRRSEEELTAGPTTDRGAPDTAGPWTAIAAKASLGSTPGFVIRDQKNDVYLIKFDPPLYPEMTTASEMITPRFLHAAGYNVPEHYLIYFDPAKIRIDPKAKFRGKYHVPRPMQEQDITAILERIPHRPDGTIRAMASKYLAGVPKGPFLYEGKRPDDPNDRILHENRRELRGFRILAAFVNHTDTKAANALDTYDPETRYLTHHLIDFSSTLGADNADPQFPRFGNEYFFDFGTVGHSTIALGSYVRPWEIPLEMHYPAVGYFESVYFDPPRWRPTYPNPAFLRMTLRDAYWGAKIVTSFTDEDIDAIVHTGRYTDARAERYVADVLKARRDKIGRYYFNLINPLDRFTIDTEFDEQVLVFENLALSRGYAPAPHALYRYSISKYVPNWFDTSVIQETLVQSPKIRLDKAFLEAWGKHTADGRATEQERPIAAVRIQTSYDDGSHWGKRVVVYLQEHPGTRRMKIVGLERET